MDLIEFFFFQATKDFQNATEMAMMKRRKEQIERKMVRIHTTDKEALWALHTKKSQNDCCTASEVAVHNSYTGKILIRMIVSVFN